MAETYLAHHGIKGQKWGVRRWQDSEGHFNEAGYERYFGGHKHRTIKSAGYRALSKVYSSNEKYYSKRQGPTATNLARANADAKAKMLKEAERLAQKAYDDRKAKVASKIEKTQASSEKSASQKNGNVVSRHKDSLVESYMQKGYSKEAATAIAEQRMRTEAIVLGVSAVALTASAIAVSRRLGQDYCDKTFKAGHVIQNVNANKNVTFKDQPFFAAVNTHDKKAYGSLYGLEKQRMEMAKGNFNAQIYKNQIALNDTVRRASVANAQKIFYAKMGSDPNFKNLVLDTLKKTAYNDRAAVADYKYDGKQSRALYDRFNQALATPEFQAAGIHKMYYDEMQKRGYNAILDINDTRYSGYKSVSKEPTIFFGDKWTKIETQKVSDLTGKYMKYQEEFVGKQQMKKLSIEAAGVYTLNSINNQAIINQYVKEHPNTQMTRREILKAAKKQK